MQSLHRHRFGHLESSQQARRVPLVFSRPLCGQRRMTLPPPAPDTSRRTAGHPAWAWLCYPAVTPLSGLSDFSTGRTQSHEAFLSGNVPFCALSVLCYVLVFPRGKRRTGTHAKSCRKTPRPSPLATVTMSAPGSGRGFLNLNTEGHLTAAEREAGTLRAPRGRDARLRPQNTSKS